MSLSSGRGSWRSRPRPAGLRSKPLVINLPTEEMEEVRDVWIEIRRRPDRNLVTAIEILSPTNKVGEGYWEYRAKRRKLIRQKVHLVELDLLAGGRRLEMDQELPPADFYAFVSRAELQAEVRGLRLVGSPAVAENSDPPAAPIPTSSSICRPCSRWLRSGRYTRALDYSAPLDLPLATADRAWAEEPRPQATGLSTFEFWITSHASVSMKTHRIAIAIRPAASSRCVPPPGATGMSFEHLLSTLHCESS